jgi:Immunoglobulin domain
MAISSIAMAAALALGLSFGGQAEAANVLVNPGAETGDFTGWTPVGTASVASTNDLYYNGGNPVGASNILTHAGEYAFKTYNNAGGATYIYQNFATAAGSQWSASVYALSHAQDYIALDSTAHLQLVFFDNTGTNILAVYGSDILDPNNPGFPMTVYPPPATNSSGWVFLQAMNQYSGVPAAEGNWLSSVPTNITAPSGTAFVQFQVEFDGGVGGGSVFWDDCVLNKLVGTDPDITTPPTALTVVAGQNATFTVVGSGNTTLSYQWKKGGSNVSGSRIGGATTATLTITNCLTSDAGSYSVVITDNNGSIQSVPVALTVLNPAAANNALGPNAGFENAPNWSPWNPFNGTGLPSTNSTYYQVTNKVNVYDGAYCAQVYDGGTDNGFWTHVACTPGSVWKAAAHAYITSTTDNLSASNTCRLQVWFQTAGGTHVGPTYECWKIYGLGYTNVYQMMPRDTWVYLPVTNVVDATDTPTNSVTSFVAPPTAAVINYQVYYYSPPGGGGTGGSVFWDDMELYQLVPVTNITTSVSANNLNLTFPTRGGLNYSVLYKANLTDPSWNVLTNGIPGTGSTITVSDQLTGPQRFYQVETQ